MSPGCAHCYAETLGKRFPKVLGEWGKGKPRVLAKNWNEPLKWDKASLAAWDKERGKGLPASTPPRHTVFPSLCDWLDDEVPVEWLARFLQLIHDTPNLKWLLLTKRPENFVSRMHAVKRYGLRKPEPPRSPHDALVAAMAYLWCEGDYPTNIWVGTSVEDQTRADERIPELLEIPAAGRFLSVEPLLGPVELVKVKQTVAPGFFGDCLQWHHRGECHKRDGIQYPTIDWVIIGGESGPGARPCNVEWIRSLVRQCKDAGVPCFVKQLGARAYSEDFGHSDDCNSEDCALSGAPGDCDGEVRINFAELTHPKGGDPAEWPEDLRVREFPWGGAK